MEKVIKGKSVAEASETEFRAAYEAGMQFPRVHTVEGINHLIVPEGAEIRSLTDYRLNPSRKKGTVTSRSVKDFIALVQREKQDNTIILCEFQNGQTVSGTCRAIIDYHEEGKKGAPCWGQYMVNLALTPTPEWSAWSAIFNKGLSQVDFAEFLEEHNADISKPEGAAVLEVALTLQARTAVQFDSGIRLQNGDTKLTFTEDTKTTAGAKGDLEVPTHIQLFIPPFDGFDPQFIDCVLRFKISGGAIVFTLKPLNLAACLRKTREQVVEEIRGETGLLVADGSFTAMGD